MVPRRCCASKADGREQGLAAERFDHGLLPWIGGELFVVSGRDRGRLTSKIVPVIMVMVVDAERARRLRDPNRRAYSGCWATVSGMPSADVVIDADDAVALGHDDVQVVRDQQHA